MTLKEMLEASALKMNEAKSLILKTDATNEDRQKADGLMNEARQLKSDADRLMTIDREGGILLDMQRGVQDEKQRQQETPKEFKAWREFLSAVYQAQKNRVHDSRLHTFDDEKSSGNYAEKDMSGATGSSGGFLIPEEFQAQLMAAMGEGSIVRQRANVIPIRRRQITIPGLDQTQSLAAGRPRWFGGLTFDWIAEGQSKPTSDAVFRDITLVAKKLVGYTRASDELVSDSAISLEAFLSGPLGFAGGVAWMEDYAFLQGTGVGQPLGVLNAPALLSVRRDVSGKIRYDDLVRMYAAHMISPNSVWLFSQTALIDLLKMEDSEGNLIWGSAVNGEAPRVLGIPYVITEKLPAHGTTGDALLCDFNYYVIADRQATTVDSTPYEKWIEDKTSWRVVHRVDGQPWTNAPFTLQDNTTQISPFVALSSDIS